MDSSNQIKVLYFHGLNSYGDEKIHLGPLTFGCMSSRLTIAFANLDVEFVPVKGIGVGTLEKQKENCLTFIKEKINEQDLGQWHLLGHSFGGLLARAVTDKLHRNGTNVASICTIATPHNGALLANEAALFSKNHPLMYITCKVFGYDTQKRLLTLGEVTQEKIYEFNKKYPPIECIPSGSISSNLNYFELSLPLRWLYMPIKRKTNIQNSDGMVEQNSQIWNQTLTTIQLDHLGQIGLNLYIHPKRRKAQTKEFNRMCLKLVEFWKQVKQ